MSAAAVSPQPMSEPLEDYLETIYLLLQEHGAARVRDIARARGVTAATVSIALGKLGDAGLLDYARREHIRLTSKGEAVARRVLTRHRLLTRFFEEVLGMSPHAASEQACSLEHALTDEATDRLVRFFEFLGTRPATPAAFGQCPVGARPGDEHPCGAASPECARCHPSEPENTMSIATLKPGQSGIVTRITATGALRQRLLDMGILPETKVDVERSGPGGQPLWVRCQGARLALRRAEASGILVRSIA